MIIEKALQYCRSILQNVSRSFALTIPLVEKNILVPILVGYLEARIMDSFEDENPGKSIDTKKRIKNINKIISIIKDPYNLEAKKNIKDIGRVAADFISNPHYLDLAQNMDKVIAVHKTMDKYAQSSISLWFGRMAKGMKKYLNKRIDTFRHLDEYCYYVGGTVGGLVTDLLIKNTGKATSSQIKTLRMEKSDFGLFLQKVNIIRDFRQDILNNEKIFWPYQLFQKQNLAPRDVLIKKNKIKAMAILEKMISNSKKHINSVKRYIHAIPEDYPGFKKASIINFLMGVMTLAKIKNNPDVFYSNIPVKIDKSIAKAIISEPIKCFENMAIKI
jgi:farnesyl-diphosphate farnesyltransferase